MKKIESGTKHAERALVKLRRAALALAKAVRDGDGDWASRAEGNLMNAANAFSAAEERDYVENMEREP